MNNKNKKVAWLVVVLISLGIFALSAQPHSAEFTHRFFGQYNGIARHLAHFLEYAVLFAALRWAASRTLRLNVHVVACLAFGACLLFALGDEWHQSFVPGRSAQLLHVGYDMAGVCTSWLVWLVIRALNKARLKRNA